MKIYRDKEADSSIRVSRRECNNIGMKIPIKHPSEANIAQTIKAVGDFPHHIL